MITYWQTPGTARFFLTFFHPCLVADSTASLPLPHPGTTGSPSCGWFLCLPLAGLSIFKIGLSSTWNPIYSPRKKKKLGLTMVPKENGKASSVPVFLIAPGIYPPLALLNKLALALLSIHSQPPPRITCVTEEPAQLWVRQWVDSHQESTVYADALPRLSLLCGVVPSLMQHK